MPEGHTIHRAARLQAAALGSGPIAVASPQGRFNEGARLLDGSTLEGIEAVGKHLFYHWDRRPILHVHLGLFGRFSTFAGETAPEPSPNARLTMAGDATIHLSGPTICELLDPIQVERVKERLGPDPLDRNADPDAFVDALGRRSIPIGAALLDQSLVAGIGNVYRAELLFLEGIHPDRPAHSTSEDERRRLWARAVELMRVGEGLGRIVTMDPRDVGAGSHRSIPLRSRLYVYKRSFEPCRRCGTEITSWDVGGRRIWACVACQPS
jgi:endonuclease-8